MYLRMYISLFIGVLRAPEAAPVLRFNLSSSRFAATRLLGNSEAGTLGNRRCSWARMYESESSNLVFLLYLRLALSLLRRPLADFR